jgi:hypothetical protein
MYTEELVDMFATHFRDKFKVPFTDWHEIMKKIEGKFIYKPVDMYWLSDWVDNVKQKTEIASVPKKELQQYLLRLESAHYWTVIAMQNNTGKHMVYDTHLDALSKFVFNFREDFFIVDKKYNWFVHFDRTTDTEITHVYKSGVDTVTGFN